MSALEGFNVIMTVSYYISLMHIMSFPTSSYFNASSDMLQASFFYHSWQLGEWMWSHWWWSGWGKR